MSKNNPNFRRQKAHKPEFEPDLAPEHIEINLPEMPDPDAFITVRRDEYLGLYVAAQKLKMLGRWAKLVKKDLRTIAPDDLLFMLGEDGEES